MNTKDQNRENDSQNQNKDFQNQKFGNQTENNWNRVRDQYREKYPSLSNEDTQYRNGKFDDMTDRIANKTNRSRDQVQDEIKNWDYDKYDDDNQNYRKQRYQNS
ncbi:hypothetical protein EV196_102410 [Mariniflexile fucanivorans]|uniref:CsbD-like protein n=1 Tax=Mariniflexile fucanivorans TaxID=264023 RepID=A0A4V2QEF8_9FLAO|nr:hypothetical protein [Mariniflexile fucanivorans]TCL67847.1 hypothetical protein EV196_102410 [Mariniflexile fucanivorans]